MNLSYTYGGRVESNKDPLKLGRVKVRVPHVYGATGGGSGFVATNDLPWALPAGMPAGGSANSGGFSQIPEVGDKVWVRFLDGEPEKPIWEWGMQSYDDSASLKLHSYKTDADGSVGAPDRTVWTRYQHAIELNAGGVIETTSGGYRLLLNDSSTPTSFDGSIKLSTPLGNMIEIDDLLSTLTINVLEDAYFQIGISFLATSFDYTWNTAGSHTTNVGLNVLTTAAGKIDFFCVEDYKVDVLAALTLDAGTSMSLVSGANMGLTTGGTFSLASAGDLSLAGATNVNLTSSVLMNLASGGAMALNFSVLSLGTGIEPFVLGNQLYALLMEIYAAYSMHTHAVVGGGGGVATPTANQFPPPNPTLLSTTIFGR